MIMLAVMCFLLGIFSALFFLGSANRDFDLMPAVKAVACFVAGLAGALGIILGHFLKT